MSAAITSGQMKRLQVLYSQYARSSLDVKGNSREERLAWAARQTGRAIASFKNLTLDEGKHLIDVLQGSMNVKAPSKGKRSKLGADRAWSAGNEGRKQQRGSNQVTLATDSDILRIQNATQRLGWDQARLDAWLRSPSSPLRGRPNLQIKTVADANRVWWGLKRLLQRAGLWKK